MKTENENTTSIETMNIEQLSQLSKKIGEVLKEKFGVRDSLRIESEERLRQVARIRKEIKEKQAELKDLRTWFRENKVRISTKYLEDADVQNGE